MVKIGSVCLALTVLASTTGAWAQDKYQETDAERAACQDDAIRLCGSAYPDQDAVLACMRTNEKKLTAACRPVFIAGLHRRGLQ